MKNNNRSRKGRRSQGGFMHRREPKEFVGNVGGGPATAGAISHVSAIAQGDGLGDRSGDKIFIERIKFSVNFLASATSNARIILFVDKHNTNTAPVVTDVLTSATVSALYNPLTITQQKRFRILMDKYFNFSLNGTLAATCQKNIKVNSPAYYGGAAATTFAAGTVWMLTIADVASASAYDIKTGVIYSDF
jgi:DNA polymerase III psi subunit